MSVDQPDTIAAKLKNTTKATSVSAKKPHKIAENLPKTGVASRKRSRTKKSSYPVSSLNAQHPEDLFTAPIVKTKRRKTSYALSAANVSLLINAIHHAERIGRPFNRFITVDWELGRVADPWAAQTRFLKFLRDWLARHKEELAYIWVMERGDMLGLHSHIMLHIPAHLIARLNKLQAGWLKRAGVSVRKPKGTPRHLRVVKSHAIGHSYGAAFVEGPGKQAYRTNLNHLARYFMKGAGAEARRTFNINGARHYGEVTGKRAGTSRNLGAGAIAEYRKARSQA